MKLCQSWRLKTGYAGIGRCLLRKEEQEPSLPTDYRAQFLLD